MTLFASMHQYSFSSMSLYHQFTTTILRIMLGPYFVLDGNSRSQYNNFIVIIIVTKNFIILQK